MDFEKSETESADMLHIQRNYPKEENPQSAIAAHAQADLS